MRLEVCARRSAAMKPLMHQTYLPDHVIRRDQKGRALIYTSLLQKQPPKRQRITRDNSRITKIIKHLSCSADSYIRLAARYVGTSENKGGGGSQFLRNHNIFIYTFSGPKTKAQWYSIIYNDKVFIPYATFFRTILINSKAGQ